MLAHIDIDRSARRGSGDLKTRAATYLRSLIEWLRRRHSGEAAGRKKDGGNTRPSSSADSRARHGIRGI